MRFKRGLLVLLLALFLAACGTQTPAPAIPTAEEGMGEINVAELEAAFDATELTNQKNWDKKKFNKFTLKKVVEGYDPNGEHHKYKLAVICKVPKKKNVLAVVGAGYLKNGQSKHFLVPTKYVKCAAFEFEKFGDEVKFELKQSKYDQYSGVKYYGKLKLWGKKLDFKASEFFHLKRGNAKFITINKYPEKEEEDKRKVKFAFYKEFKDHYNLDQHDIFHVALYCNDERVESVRVELTKDTTYAYAYAYYKDVAGKYCYIKEYYLDKDGHYALKKVDFHINPYGDSSDDSDDHTTAYSHKFHIADYKELVKTILKNELKEKHSSTYL
jgi:hypothetical protein